MKNLFKKVAFVLALAMVLTNIAPAAAASAAVAPSLKYTTKVIYDGGSMFGDYTNTCYTPSVNTTGYKVTYEVTTGKDLITVAANGKITATGDGIGKAVVTVTYTPEDGGKVTTAKFTVKVRRNATHTRLTKAVAAKFDEALAVGQEVVLQAAKSATTPASYAKGNYGLDNYMGVVSDQIAYKVSDDEIIKVTKNDDGKYVLTAVGAGEAVLTVYTYEYGDKEMIATREMEYKVTVAGGLLNVSQSSVTTLKVSVGFDAANVKAADFAVTRVSDTVDFGIKSIAVSSDNKTVTIETYSPMDDGEEYTVSYGEYSYTFTATEGTVASMRINKTVIPFNFASTIVVDLLDAEGIVIASVKESTAAENNVEWNWSSTSGAMYDDKLILYTKGDTAELTVTYRPGKYDDQGNEIGVVGPQTYKITAMDVAVDANILATLAGNPWDVCVYNWSGVAGNESRNLYAEESKFLHVLITDSEGTEITQNLFSDYGYYFESSNENVLTVGAATLHDHTGDYIADTGVYADIYGVKAGTANVLVKNSDGKVVFTIQITVGAVRKFVGFDIDKSSITLSNTPFTTDVGTVYLTAKDQYGALTWVNHIDDRGAAITTEFQSGQNDTNYPEANGAFIDWGNGLMGISFTASGCEAGSYRYKITFEENGVTATRYITVVVKEAVANSGSFSYKLVVGGTQDSTYQTWNSDNKNTTVRIARYKGGILYDYLDYSASTTDTYIKDLTVTHGKNAVKVDGGTAAVTGTKSGAANNSVGTVTGSVYTYPVAINVEGATVGTITGSVVTKASTGARTVQATIYDPLNDKSVTVKGSFTLADYQESMTATIDKTSVTASTIEEMMKEVLTFKHEGYKEINADAEASNIRITKIKVNSSTEHVGAKSIYEALGNATSGKIYVSSVTVAYDKGNGDYVTYTVNVNRTISVKIPS